MNYALVTAVSGLLSLVGCAGTEASLKTGAPAEGTSTRSGSPAAVADLESRSESSVNGRVEFYSAGPERVEVVVSLSGLTPGKHGFHLHEKGDCSAPDGTSAGGHWNPTGALHGGFGDPARHVGDFGNVVAGEDGKASATFELTMSLTGDQGAIGRAVIVHQKEDDLKTQPTGNSGARVACGLVLATP